MTATLDANTTEVLDYLSSHYAPDELESIAGTLDMATQYTAWLQSQQDSGELSFEETYFRTSLCAVMTEAIIERHGAIATPAILKASLADLREWEPAYFEQLTELFNQQLEIEKSITSGDFASNAAWALCRAKFARLAGFLFETRARLGVHVYSGHLVREGNVSDA